MWFNEFPKTSSAQKKPQPKPGLHDLTANAILDVLANNIPDHGGRITTRRSQVLGAPFRFRECIFSVVENHSIGSTTSLVPVNI
jgi:hypothetical protein